MLLIATMCRTNTQLLLSLFHVTQELKSSSVHNYSKLIWYETRFDISEMLTTLNASAAFLEIVFIY